MFKIDLDMMRYAIDPSKIVKELGWYPETPFVIGIEKTIRWYLDNQEWMENVTSGDYQKYYEKMNVKKHETIIISYILTLETEKNMDLRLLYVLIKNLCLIKKNIYTFVMWSRI